jgi:hypothetical protein
MQLVRTTFTSPDDLAKRVLASLQRYKPTKTTQEGKMSDEAKKQTQIGGVNFSGISGGSISVGNIDASVKAGGDIVGGDKITTTTQVAPTGPDSPQAILEAALEQWRKEIQPLIARLSDEDDQEYVEKTAAKVVEEVKKGEAADPGKIEGFLERIGNMAPDIMEVTAKTLQNPFAGVGLVLEKINNRIKLEQQAK